MENELHEKFEIEFYNVSMDEDMDAEYNMVKKIKKTGYKSDVEAYAQDQIDLGKFDGYIVYYVGK